MHKINSYSHIAFHCRDAERLVDFYCNRLGMKRKFTISTDTILDFHTYQERIGAEDPGAEKWVAFAREHPGLPLITYVEMAWHQYLEFFHIHEELEEPGDLAGKYGYQHLAIEVENLEDTYAEMLRNGVEPDTEINMGPDFTKQFWIHDPEGNRIEFMEYTERSLQR